MRKSAKRAAQELQRPVTNVPNQPKSPGSSDHEQNTFEYENEKTLETSVTHSTRSTITDEPEHTFVSVDWIKSAKELKKAKGKGFASVPSARCQAVQTDTSFEMYSSKVNKWIRKLHKWQNLQTQPNHRQLFDTVPKTKVT